MTYRYTIKETSQPAVEPISLSEAKTFLRISHDGDDVALATKIKAARQFCEMYTGQSIIAHDFRVSYVLNSFKTLKFKVPKAPLISVASVKFINKENIETTLTSERYTVDTDLNCVVLKEDLALNGFAGVLKITFNAGYGATADDVPENLRHAVLMKMAQLYEYRGDSGEQPNFDIVASLLKPYKKIKLG